MSFPREAPRLFSVLQHRDFRLLWAGQVLSMVGSRMQGAALLWHLWTLTHDPGATGAIGLARMLPVMGFALLGGVVADALDRRRLMLACQVAMALLAVGLGMWSYAGLAQAWPIYVVAGLNAGLFAFDGPARQSLIPTLVPREQLPGAIRLNSVTSQFASVLGPALTGLILAQQNVGLVYLLNAASFITVIGALLLMRPAAAVEPEARPKVSLAAALEGLRFIRHSRLLLSLMLLDFLANLFASANVLLPMYAEEILKVGARGYGWLAAAPSVGALVGACAMALCPPIRRQGLVVLWAVLFYGMATIVFGLSRDFWICLLALAASGAADMISTVLRQTIRQLVTPDELRGRMHSINMLFVQGGPQLGEVEAGLVAGWKGAPFSVVTGGIACVVTVLVMAWRAPVLRKYADEPGGAREA